MYLASMINKLQQDLNPELIRSKVHSSMSPFNHSTQRSIASLTNWLLLPCWGLPHQPPLSQFSSHMPTCSIAIPFKSSIFNLSFTSFSLSSFQPDSLWRTRGTGNTLNTKSIGRVLQLRNNKRHIFCESSLDSSASRQGRPANFTFKIRILWNESESWKNSAKCQLAKELQNVDLIVWDNIWVCQRYCSNTPDYMMQDRSQSWRPFERIVVLFSADFWQILLTIQGWSCAKECSFMRQDLSSLAAVLKIAIDRIHAPDTLEKWYKRRYTCPFIFQLRFGTWWRATSYATMKTESFYLFPLRLTQMSGASAIHF